MYFADEVFNAQDLPGIFAGHIHSQTFDLVKGIPQFVAGAIITGAFPELNYRN